MTAPRLLPGLALLLALLPRPAAATRIAVRAVACPVGAGTVRIYERLSSDTHGGFDSDLAAYSSEGQYREYAVSTCTDSLFSLYGADMERLPLDAEIKGRLSARLDGSARPFPPVERIEVWDRYRIAAEMYRVLGRDPVFIGDLLHRASWTARDRAVGIFEGSPPHRRPADAGPGPDRAGQEPRSPPAQDPAAQPRPGGPPGWLVRRARSAAGRLCRGGISAPKRPRSLATFKQAAQVVEPALQDEAIAAYRSALAQPSLAMDEKVRVTFVLADLLRRRGRYSEAQAALCAGHGGTRRAAESAGDGRLLVARHRGAAPQRDADRQQAGLSRHRCGR